MAMDETARARFPIGFWNYVAADRQGAESVQDWADAGITCAQSPSYDPAKHEAARMLALLDAAHEKGIRVIICDARSTAWAKSVDAFDAASYRAGMAAAVSDFGGHPAVFGFHLGDEPSARACRVACEAYKIQKELAPHLSPFLNHHPWYDGIYRGPGFFCYEDYLDNFVTTAHAELLATDCYSQMQPNPYGVEQYHQNLFYYLRASQRHEAPYWMTLLSVGHFDYRPPNEDDLRWQLNTAVAHGAKGILWFCFYLPWQVSNYRVTPIDEHGERTETFRWLSRVNRTFLNTRAPVLQGLTLHRVWHVKQAYGGFPLLPQQGGGRILLARTDQPLIITEYTDSAGRDYVSVVNNTPKESVRVEVCIKGRHPTLHRVAWDSEEESVDNGYYAMVRCEDAISVTSWYAPGQMELFRVEDDRQL